MKRAAAVLIASVLGCGGTSGSDPGGPNVAETATFNYGTAGTASSSQTQSVTRQFGSAGQLSAATAISAVDVSTITTAVLGTSAVGFLRSAPEELILGNVSNPALSNQNCVTQSGSTITFTACLLDFSSGGNTETETINGSVTATNTDSSWNLTFAVHLVESSITVDETVRLSGEFHVTSTTIKGTMRADVKFSATNLGSFEVNEAVILDLGYATPFCITSGTLEAKRVWITKPNAASGAAFANQGGKMTWTGCNHASLAHSTP